jgi:hypothetical protein
MIKQVVFYGDLFGIKKTDIGSPVVDIKAGSTAAVLQIVFGLAAGIAIIIIMLAALKYITSQGEPAEVAKAKNAIIYAVIGLAVCIFAFSIVAFVVRAVQ